MNSSFEPISTVAVMTIPALLHKHSLNIATALLFALAFWRLGLSPELPAVLAFIFGGMLLAVIDWKVHRLPTRIVYYTLAGVAAGLVFASLVEWDVAPLATAVLGALLFTNAFFLIWLFTTKYAGMMMLGYGDVRLAAVLGLLLGWYGLPFVLYGALAGHLLALGIAVATCIRKRQLHMTYSFGPPLIAGTLAVVLFAA
jgi:leader peptidase (prepilin peptidase)/N-methyltransferase